MRGDDGIERFPFVRRRGNVALIALSTGVPTGPFMATGRLGDRQLSRFAEALDQTRDAFRIVLIHHPPLSPLRRYLRRLIDARGICAACWPSKAPNFCSTATITNAPLVWLDGPRGTKIPAVGVPSASAAAPHGDEDAGRLHLFRIDGDARRLALRDDRARSAAPTARSAKSSASTLV